MAYSHQAPRAMTLHHTRRARAGALAMPRRRGASAGTALVLLGIWGAIIPFIGPMFGYSWDTAGSWTFTWDRLWLNILPGAAAIVGGLILIGAADRLSAVAGSWLAVAGGAWFVIGPSVSLLWGSPAGTTGIGSGSPTHRFIEQIGFFYGLGVVVTALAAGALARVMVRSERDALLLESAAATATTATGAATGVAEPTDVATERPYAPGAVEPAPAGSVPAGTARADDAGAGGVAADVPPGGDYQRVADESAAPPADSGTDPRA